MEMCHSSSTSRFYYERDLGESQSRERAALRDEFRTRIPSVASLYAETKTARDDPHKPLWMEP